MNKSQKVLLHMIKAAIQSDSTFSIPYKSVNWESVLKEARQHQVQAMLYPFVSEHLKEEIPDSVRQDWKRQTLQTAIFQMEHISQTALVIEALRKQEIEVIALKGLVVRNAYPRPELRSMCDADLLAHKEDLKRIENILVNMGYRAKEESFVHTQYTHPLHCGIEIHWTIRDKRIFKEIDGLEEELWENAGAVKVGGAETKSLGTEDMMLHLISHMATHLRVGGFGIRQVLDLTLWIDYKKEQINWEDFWRKINKWELETFALAVLMICYQQFKARVPEKIRKAFKGHESVAEDLLEDIMRSGVHGKKDKIEIISNELAGGGKEHRPGQKSWVLLNYIRYIFPPCQKLSESYGYAARHPALLGAAWLHHLWRGITAREYSLFNKLQFLCTAWMHACRRSRLLRQLKL